MSIYPGVSARRPSFLTGGAPDPSLAGQGGGMDLWYGRPDSPGAEFRVRTDRWRTLSADEHDQLLRKLELEDGKRSAGGGHGRDEVTCGWAMPWSGGGLVAWTDGDVRGVGYFIICRTLG